MFPGKIEQAANLKQGMEQTSLFPK